VRATEFRHDYTQITLMRIDTTVGACGSLADGPYVADFSNRPDRRVTYAYIVSSGLFGWLVASHAASRPVKILYSPRLRSPDHHAAEM